MWKFLDKGTFLLVAVTALEIFTLTLMKTTLHNAVIFILYGILGLGLRFIIKERGLVSGNAIYDILGIVGSSLIAFFYFGEKLTYTNSLGIVLALVSLFMLNL
jgi:multidrug transporter EmrE-like cation transporter